MRDVTLVACNHCTRGLEPSWAFCPWCGWAQAPRPHANPARAPRCEMCRDTLRVLDNCYIGTDDMWHWDMIPCPACHGRK